MSNKEVNGFEQETFKAALSDNAKSTFTHGSNILLVVVTFREMPEAFICWGQDELNLEISALIAPKNHATREEIYGIDKSIARLFKPVSGFNKSSLSASVKKELLKSTYNHVVVLQGSLPAETYRGAMEAVFEIVKGKPVFIVKPDGNLQKAKRTTKTSIHRSSVTTSKKVVLINAGSDVTSIHSIPFNLAPLAQCLIKRGHEVSVLEHSLMGDVGKTLEELKPDVVGVTATTLSYNDACYILSEARERLNARLIIGGRHATVYPYPALKYADVVVVGEGESAIVEAVESNNPPSVINGKPLLDLSGLPATPFEVFDMPFYMGARDRVPWGPLRFAPPGSTVGQLFTSRGCPWNCVFCHNSYLKLPLRFHSLNALEHEIDVLNKEWGCEYFFFFDDDLLANRKRFIEVMSLLKNRFGSIQWAAQSRATSIDDELAAIAKDSGCIQLNFGFESGSQRVLRLLKNNKTDLEDNRRALQICRRHGIKTFCTFMIGAPDETEEEMKMTERFILEEDMDDAAFFIVTPYPGTLLWNKYIQKNGLMSETGPELWSRFHMGPESFNLCTTMPAEKLREIYYETLNKMARRFNHIIVSPHADTGKT